jgi:hypothetical protein
MHDGLAINNTQGDSAPSEKNKQEWIKWLISNNNIKIIIKYLRD